MKKLIYASVGAAALMASAQAQGAVIYLDFEGIAPYPNNNSVQIAGYYNGGTASNGNSGTNFGVEFTTDALLLCLNTAGTTCSNTSRGGQGISTSQLGALFFPSANPIMNVAAGFDTGFAGVYSDPFSSGSTVSIFDGLNGTGNLLASITLPNTAAGACNSQISSGAQYCPFNSFSLSFSGTARSVVFGGQVNAQVFDDFTFGSNVVGGIPEPSTWAMLILGFGAVGATLRRRRQSVRFSAA